TEPTPTEPTPTEPTPTDASPPEPSPPLRKPSAAPAQARVQPVLLPAPHAEEPPLPRVSKELRSGHSWMWALPQSIRDSAAPSYRNERGRFLITLGLTLMLVGGGLIGAAFFLGLTPTAINKAVGDLR
ncbi:MAG: hypothetical protein JKY37_23660, partial [Nannocystaceae bacterium]|nr:hypothetical protein [Nannocystaceae bacterium]